MLNRRRLRLSDHPALGTLITEQRYYFGKQGGENEQCARKSTDTFPRFMSLRLPTCLSIVSFRTWGSFKPGLRSFTTLVKVHAVLSMSQPPS